MAFFVLGHSILYILPVVITQREVSEENDPGLGLIALFILITSVVQIRSGRMEAKKFELIQNTEKFEVIYL